jgi:hypothetical protein
LAATCNLRRGLTLLAAGLALTGCSWIREDTQFAMQREWERFKGYDWADATDKLTGFTEAFPSATQKEAKAEQQICLHPNGGTRVTQQDGISDQVAYRRCALGPYATDSGQRIGRRPDW